MNTYSGFIVTPERIDNYPIDEDQILFKWEDVVAEVEKAFADSATKLTVTRHNSRVGIAFFNFSNHDAGVRAKIQDLFDQLGDWNREIFGFCSAYDDEHEGIGRHLEFRFNYPSAFERSDTL
ncbi:hypothetical protein [Erythrobacter sp. EC-HK427]|uniref:hypothetical protein n=1 Tax=Erythrobacter sp. EC-HK427 TaxID=2038396 RepID=UPI001253A1E8|nr:hypothetical protein [Erythrobacter sp. EC-HK427]VVT13020.1 hypothetical protein ERY430_60426 [Erythrobacter sp. EC-HK427]